jgi:hypothetical protein
VAGALLFLGYLRVSWTVAATSDGAAEALQARDMLAGNWLLHGWTIGDVSFYTTELPEYILVEVIRPFGLGVIHIAAAATYTMLVLTVFALGYGRARGREGILRGVLAAGIMLAPQLGYGAFVLLLSPDHTGTELPVLLGWLLLDLAPRRWWVPTILCLLLAEVQFSDRAALLTAVLPLIVASGLVAARGLARRRGRECRFELALIAAGIGSVGVAWAAARLLAAAGGFVAHPFSLTLAPLAQLGTHAWLTGWAILELYGGNFIGVTGWPGLTFAALHLIGLTLAIAAVAVALVRFVWPPADQRIGAVGHNAKRTLAPWATTPIGVARWATTTTGAGRGGPQSRTGGGRGGPQSQTGGGRGGPQSQTGGCAPGLVDSVLAVAIVANLLSYLLSTAPGTVLGTGYDAREIAAVLPLGAVLAGRVFGPALARPVFGTALARPVLGTAPAGPAPAHDPAGSAPAHDPAGPAPAHDLAGPVFADDVGRPWSGSALDGQAKATVRSKKSICISLAFFLVIAGYASAFGYSAAQGASPGQDSALAGWLVAHGLQYGLGESPANVVTVETGARVEVEPVAVAGGRVRALLYQSSAAAYDPRLHDADFLVTRAPGAESGESAQTVPDAAVRATFGPPARSYRFDGYAVLVWNVNLLTRMAQ